MKASENEAVQQLLEQLGESASTGAAALTASPDDSTALALPLGRATQDAAELKRATGDAFRALRALVEKSDPAMTKTGLEKVKADKDGWIEWVSAEAKERFHREGRAALFYERQASDQQPLDSARASSRAGRMAHARLSRQRK